MIKFLIIVFITFSFKGNTALPEKLICSYNFGQKITLENITEKKVKRKYKENDLKYRLSIQDVKNPSEIEDYLVIENKKGHRITYSLNCR